MEREHELHHFHNSLRSLLDVLGIIFSYYAQEESIFHPLETLFLVCKSWKDAALGHRALWTRLAIHISHSPSHKIWKARLPLRLERCGTSLPLHIDLRNTLPADPTEWEDLQFKYEDYSHTACTEPRGPHNHCSSVEAGFLCIDELLLILAGPEGELCKRWKTLHLELPHVGIRPSLKYKQLQTVLAYPMPILTCLMAHGLHDVYNDVQPWTFPSTPSLTYLTINLFRGWIPSMPSFRTVRWMCVIDPHFRTCMPSRSIPILEDVGNLEELVVYGECILASSMRNLQKLKVTGAVIWMPGGTPDLPSLTHLSLECCHLDWLSDLVESPTVDLSQLVSFGLRSPLKGSTSPINLAVVEMLWRTKTLAFIHGDSMGLAFILKVVWETEEGSSEVRLLAGQEIRLSLEPGGGCEMLRGDESSYQLCVVAVVLGIEYPDSPRGDILYLEGEDDYRPYMETFILPEKHSFEARSSA